MLAGAGVGWMGYTIQLHLSLPLLMRILIITPFVTTFGRFGTYVHTGGGVAVRYESYEQSLLEAGHSVRVLSPDRQTIDTFELMSSQLVAPAMHGFPFIGLTLSNLRTFLSAFAWCDCVVMPENTQICSISALGYLLRKPVVLNIHTNVAQMVRSNVVTGWVAERLYYAAIKGAKMNPQLVCNTVSETNREVLEREGIEVSGVYELQTRQCDELSAEERARIRQQLAPGVSSDTPLVLFAGRFLKEKRIDRLVACLPANAALVLVGSGHDNVHGAHHDPSKLVFVHAGFVPNDVIYKYYQAADWVANASDFETFGNTSYEANSVGTPCILHPKGGHLSQIAKEGSNGWFVNFDAADDVAKESFRRKLFERPRPTREQIREGVRAARPANAVSIRQAVEDAVARAAGRKRGDCLGRIYIACALLLGTLANIVCECLVLGVAGWRKVPARPEAKAKVRLIAPESGAGLNGAQEAGGEHVICTNARDTRGE